MQVKQRGSWWIVPMLAVIGLGAAERGTPLIDAVKKGDAQAVRALRQQRADVNISETDGATARHWAVHRDDVEAAELLIRAGANVSVANRYGVTPLYLASVNGS